MDKKYLDKLNIEIFDSVATCKSLLGKEKSKENIGKMTYNRNTIMGLYSIPEFRLSLSTNEKNSIDNCLNETKHWLNI